jgi:heptosyltransferase-2
VDRFISAAAEIQRRLNCRWIILGGPNEKEMGGQIAAGIEKRQSPTPENKQSSVVNLAGKTSLRDLCSVLKLCRVLLTNDSGPMHLAAAVGTRVVVPFGSTSPELTGPGNPGETRHAVLSARVPCSPCFLRVCPIDMRCMTGISETRVAEAVIAAAGKHLDK